MNAEGVRAFDDATTAMPFDRQLANWQCRIANAAANCGGLNAYRDALNWAKQDVPPDNGLCEKAKLEIREAAERHLADTHGLAVIDAIYGAAFPEEVGDDLSELNACDVCAWAPCLTPGFCQACRVADAQIRPQHTAEPRSRPTPRTTIEAILWRVRERGSLALHEPANIERLRRCDAAARTEINKRIAHMIAAKEIAA